jgi:SagB-type dehydrogenase family enzyme
VWPSIEHRPLSRYRINPELIASFADGAMTLHVPGCHRRLGAEPVVLRLVQAVCEPTGTELAALEREYTSESLSDGLAALAAAGVLLNGEEEPRLPTAWQEWGEPAWFLHLASRDTRFAISADDQLAAAREVAGSQPPPRYKCLCDGNGLSLKLPRPRLARQPLSETLLGRRTCRNFSAASLSLADVADLAFYTAGVVFENDTRYFGTVLKKCAPSPGARHATELYLVLRRCLEAPAGIYHYCVRHHRLNRLAEPNLDEFLPAALVGQDYFAAAPLVAFFTCVVRRLMWKYKGPRIYRLAHLEAGHYCQNFLLAGTSLGLGVFCTGALVESVIEPALGIDGVEEIALYTAGAGHEEGRPYSREGVRISDHLPGGSQPKLPGEVNAVG